MLRRRLPTVLALGLVAALATSPLAWADPSLDRGPAGRHGHERFQQALGLTDEQVAAIREVHDRHAPELKQLGQSLRQARIDLKQAALNGGDIKGKAAAVTALLGQMTELRATTLQEIAPILSPEQRDAMVKMSPRGHWHRGPRPS